jgi:HNH endonuclease/helix-turn-helix, Psq domain
MGRGLCSMHYWRWRRHGNLIGVRPEEPAHVRFEKYVDRGRSPGCWLWTSTLNNRGYGRFSPGGSSITFPSVYAHRWAYEHFIGPIPAGLVVMHTCDTPACVNPAHLIVGTQAENSADMVIKGRTPCWKLTPDQVSAVRQIYSAGGISQRALAREYGVSQTTIGETVRRERWRS